MRRERESPPRQARVLEDRLQGRLRQFHVQQQELRHRRVHHVHGPDAAVAEVLFRKHQRRAVHVGHDLLSRKRLAVRHGHQGRVLRTASLLEIAHQLLVVALRALDDGWALREGDLQQRDCVGTVPPPVRPQPAVEELDRIQVVVGEHHLADDRFGLYVAGIDREGQRGRAGARRPREVHVVGFRERAVAGERRPGLGLRRHGRGDAGARRGGIEVSPVDPHVVAPPRQHRLVLRADAQHLGAGHLHARRHDPLVGGVDGEVPRGGEQQLHVMGPRVERAQRPAKPGDGARHPLDVVGERRRDEVERDGHPFAAELVAGGRRPHRHRHLLEGRHLPGITPREAHDLAIDARLERNRLRLPGPVARALVGEPVGERPDREVRIDRDERRGGRADLLGERRVGGGEGDERHGDETMEAVHAADSGIEVQAGARGRDAASYFTSAPGFSSPKDTRGGSGAGPPGYQAAAEGGMGVLTFRRHWRKFFAELR